MNVSDVCELLDRYAARFDEPETVAGVRKLVSTVPEAWQRTIYEPGHLTASAFVVDRAGRFVALVDHPVIGRWLQPGGHIEPGDPTVEAAARREVAEELGLEDLESDGLLDVDIHRFPERGGAPTHLHFDMRYLFLTDRRRLQPQSGEARAAWVPVERALRMQASIARPTGKALRAVAGRR